MHKDEIWQVYKPNGEPDFGVGWDSGLDNPEKTNQSEIVGVAVVFLFRVNDEGILELLWQKRSELINRYPGDYDISAGGHINLGESLVEAAVRETREEIGAEITTDDLHFVTERGFNQNRFAWVYAVDWTGRPEEFHFDDNEVSEVKWVPFSKTEEFKKRFGKEPLKKDSLTFALLGDWFKQNGYL